MRILLLPLSARFIAYTLVVLATAILLIALLAGNTSVFILIPLVPFAALSALGTMDLIQTRHAVLRNYPLIAHIRFILEEIRPEIRQYFIESENDGTPFSRDKRSLVYQRAKRASDKRPFGTQLDVYASGYEWINHSIAPKHPVARSRSASIVGGRIAAALFGHHLQHLGDELRRAQRRTRSARSTAAPGSGNFAHDTGEGGYQSATTARTAATSSGRSARATSAAATPTARSARRSSRKRARSAR